MMIDQYLARTFIVLRKDRRIRGSERQPDFALDQLGLELQKIVAAECLFAV
jgi:hypothetical protein